MIKFIRNFWIFFLGALILISIIIYASSRIHFNEKHSVIDRITQNPVKKGGETFLKFYEALYINKSIDILVIGSSKAYRAFDPSIFEQYGINIHILASARQVPLNSYFVLKTYLDIIKPKLVIIDVHHSLFNNDGLECFYDLCTNTKISPNLLEMAVEINKPNTYTLFASKLIEQLCSPLYYEFEYKPHKFNYKGFVISYKSDTTLTWDKSNTSYHRNITQMELNNFNYLEKCIEFVKKRNIELILTKQPVLWREPIETNQKIFELAKMHDLTYLDLSILIDKMNIQNDFYDKSHLNTNGAKIISEFIIEELRGKKLF